jgi:hypothetical protein
MTTEPYGKKNPFPAPVLSVRHITGEGSPKETIHIEYSLEAVKGKGGEREKFLFAPREKQGREGENLPCPHDNFCEPRKPVPFKTSENTLRCCLCPLKIFSLCRGAFHPFRATAGNVKKLGGKRKIPSG